MGFEPKFSTIRQKCEWHPVNDGMFYIPTSAVQDFYFFLNFAVFCSKCFFGIGILTTHVILDVKNWLDSSFSVHYDKVWVIFWVANSIGFYRIHVGLRDGTWRIIPVTVVSG